MRSRWLLPERRNGERQIVVFLRCPFPGGTGAGPLFEVPKRNPMLRCQGFRQDGILDDHTGSPVIVAFVIPDHRLPEAPRA
jgi:hypothetical protein